MNGEIRRVAPKTYTAILSCGSPTLQHYIFPPRCASFRVYHLNSHRPFLLSPARFWLWTAYRVLYQNMFQNLWTVIYAGVLLLLLFPLPSFSATVCDASIYGNPDPSDCSRILHDKPSEGSQGLESKDRNVAHLFYARTIDKRPQDVTPTEWKNRVQLDNVVYSRGKWNSEAL